MIRLFCNVHYVSRDIVSRETFFIYKYLYLWYYIKKEVMKWYRML
nr:MAG TPA: hypothetical protein [Caudoviricetes sp.]